MSQFRNKYQITLWVTVEEELAIMHLFQSKGWQYVNYNISEPRQHIEDNNTTSICTLGTSYSMAAELPVLAHSFKNSDTIHGQCTKSSVSNGMILTSHETQHSNLDVTKDPFVQETVFQRSEVQCIPVVQVSYEKGYCTDGRLVDDMVTVVTENTIQTIPEIHLYEEQISQDEHKSLQVEDESQVIKANIQYAVSLKHGENEPAYINENTCSRKPVENDVATDNSDVDKHTHITENLGTCNTERTESSDNLQVCSTPRNHTIQNSHLLVTNDRPTQEYPDQPGNVRVIKFGVDITAKRTSDEVSVIAGSDSSCTDKNSHSSNLSNSPDKDSNNAVESCDISAESSITYNDKSLSTCQTNTSHELVNLTESESSAFTDCIAKRKGKRQKVFNKKNHLKSTVVKRQIVAKKVREENKAVSNDIELQSKKPEDPILMDEDKNLNEMSILIVNDNAVNPYMCCMCNTGFSTIDTFKQHAHFCLLELHGTNKSAGLQCKDCLAHYRQAFTLVRHRLSQVCQTKKAERDRAFHKCEYCGKCYPSRRQTDFTLHVMLHQNNKPHVCEVCGKKFIRWTSLRNHKRIHTGERPYKCGYCPKTFTTGSHQRNHELLKHIEVPRSFICEKCGAAFKFSGGLSTHMKEVHTDEKNFSCTICGKQFKRKGAVTEHMKNHSNRRDKTCGVCGKSFNRQSDLNKHAKRHTDVRTIFCDDCGKGFFTKQSLLLHKRVHTGEKPFACAACTYKCTTNGNLKKHMRALHPELLA